MTTITGHSATDSGNGVQRIHQEDQSATVPEQNAPSHQSSDSTDGTGRLARMLLSGLAGAVTVTVLNETVRHMASHAPRMDVLGERAVRKTMRAAGHRPPEGRALYRWTMAGDLLSNALYYSLAGTSASRHAWTRGAALGLTAGLSTAVLPQRLGFGRQPNARTPRTEALTAAWYLAGGLAAAATARMLRADR